MSTRNTRSLITLAAILAIASIACGSSGSSSSGSSASPSLSGIPRQGADAALTEVQKKWVKTTDGWVTARWEGSGLAPVRFIRQVREIAIDHAGATDLSEADKANGIVWAVNVGFKKSLVREAGDIGFVLSGNAGFVDRPKGRWSQWVEYQLEDVQVLNVNGAVRVNEDTWLLRGTQPTSQDYANAGISMER
jgi:hypothetical protein